MPTRRITVTIEPKMMVAGSCDGLTEAQVACAQPVKCRAIGSDDIRIDRRGGRDEPGVIFADAP